MLHEIVDFVVNMVAQLGYIGIFVMMFLESSFFLSLHKIMLLLMVNGSEEVILMDNTLKRDIKQY